MMIVQERLLKAIHEIYGASGYFPTTTEPTVIHTPDCPIRNRKACDCIPDILLPTAFGTFEVDENGKVEKIK